MQNPKKPASDESSGNIKDIQASNLKNTDKIVHSQKFVYLESAINKGIDAMKSKGDRNKSRSYIVRVSSAVLGALITVALGLQITSLTTELKNFALVCGALISVVNAIDSVVGYRALWVKQKLTLSQLYTLRNELAFYKAGLEDSDPVDEDKLRDLFAKYQEIWDAASKEWLRIRKEQEEEEGTKGN